MKKMIVAIVMATSTLSSHSAQAYVSVDGYYRSNGTYVAPHIRTSPDGVCWNNFSGC